MLDSTMRSGMRRAAVWAGGLLAACALPACGAAGERVALVRDGKPCGAIVVQEPASTVVAGAIEEVQYLLRRACGAELPVVAAKDEASLPPETVRVLFGFGKLTDAMGLVPDDLPREAFRICRRGNRLVFQGSRAGPGSRRRREESSATLWAVTWFADRRLGVRYLWPGDVGTHVPRRDTILLDEFDVTARPELLERTLRIRPTVRSMASSLKGRGLPPLEPLLDRTEEATLEAEARQWLARHQMGSRSPYRFGHSFGAWWKKYHEDHPDLFAYSPEGKPFGNTERSKLNVGNEEVDAFILREWQKAGAPDNWNICHNDGNGFASSPESRALDDEPRPSPEVCWGGGTAGAYLTPRYVRFWNRLIPKMRAINPNVTISVYAYNATRRPPPKSLKIAPGVVVKVVPSYKERDLWQGWYDAGTKILLRPNWWHGGGMAPNLLLREQGGYFQFARQRGMLGFDFDSILGDWATKGPCYYLIARMSVRPDLSIDEIVGEYGSAFGAAGPAVREYLDCWQRLASDVDFGALSGNPGYVPKRSLAQEAIKKHELEQYSRGMRLSWYLLPFIYTDDVLAKSRAILDRADKQAGGADRYVTARLRFLRDGLDHLQCTRDLVVLGIPHIRPPGTTVEDFRAKRKELMEMRRKLSPTHAVWGDFLNYTEIRRLAPTLEHRARLPRKKAAGKKESSG